jgi:hypothetical protein
MVVLTPRSRFLLEKLTGSQLVKKFPAFFGTRKFITAFSRARHLSLSWARSSQSMLPHPTSWRSILILELYRIVSRHIPGQLPWPETRGHYIKINLNGAGHKNGSGLNSPDLCSDHWGTLVNMAMNIQNYWKLENFSSSREAAVVLGIIAESRIVWGSPSGIVSRCAN